MAFSRSFCSFAPAVSRQRALPSWSAVKRLRRAAPQPCSTPRLARMCSYAGPQSDMAAEMLNFINYSWTPFHAVEEASRRLMAAGFQHLKENAEWHLKPGSKYFFTRNMSTIVAFAVGKKYEPGNAFYMVGAHTDSPCLKVKPVSRGKKSDFLMLNVECYGGGLWATWFDRDLSVAGRVLIRDARDGRLYHRLVKVARPIMRIPMLAIHLNRDIGTAGFNPSKQTHIVPVLATAVKAALERYPTGPDGNASTRPNGRSSTPRAGTEEAGERHHPLLLRMLAEELGCQAGEIEDLELNVCDTQDGVVAGAANEFVYVGRLDNLAMSYCALQALLDACLDDRSLDEETGVRAVALFDHEEVGSTSAQGAGGPVMRDTISRVSRCMAEGSRDAVERALRSSFLVSADMAHALHPNYPEKHDGEHAPQFHRGLVLKHNGNQRYATNAVSAALFREVGRRAGVPYQEFCVRNDMPCGSTIGPILSSNLGCRTLDVGMPQLSMHSIREMCGTDDVYYSYKHFLEFFQAFSVIDGMLDMDSAPPANVLGTISEQACNHVH